MSIGLHAVTTAQLIEELYERTQSWELLGLLEAIAESIEQHWDAEVTTYKLDDSYVHVSDEIRAASKDDLKQLNLI